MNTKIFKNVYLILEDIAEHMWRSIMALCVIVCIGWIFNNEGIKLVKTNGRMFYIEQD